ncbi:MAG: MBL fold metallo-hydrolase [Bacteroidetes bacterium]|nr:MBL fold metallo-hydrolase [Bacteroidota bacterium]
MVHIIDLHFQMDHTIASFVVETTEGPVVIETGPHSVYPQLVAGLQKLGYQSTDVKHVLLTHIHFDHAGAAWAFAEQGATVYVHPNGWKHLQDPTRLYNSAKRIYQDQMETLWGDMKQIPAEKLIAVEDQQILSIGGIDFQAWHTPGHASHHIAWQMGATVFTGDVAGCKIQGGPVVPPCPPPDINLELWYDSVETVRSLNPETLYLTHFGEINDPNTHLDAVKSILQDWGAWMKPRWEAGKSAEEVTPEFQAYAADQLRAAGLDEAMVQKYEAANPAWMSVAGLMRYWQKKSEGAF